MKDLNQHHITIVNKFSKRILKNSYVLELYKKYLWLFLGVLLYYGFYRFMDLWILLDLNIEFFI